MFWSAQYILQTTIAQTLHVTTIFWPSSHSAELFVSDVPFMFKTKHDCHRQHKIQRMGHCQNVFDAGGNEQ